MKKRIPISFQYLPALLAMLCCMGLVSKGQSQQAYPSKQLLSTPSVQPALTKVKHQRQKSGTVVWGVGGTNGVADAEFQNAFSTGAISNTQWSAISISQSGGTVAPGSAYWERNTTGTSQGAFFGTVPPMASPSRANGVALFDSDFLDNAGAGLSGLGTGTSPSPHIGELISPSIDLTGYTDSALTLNFYLMWRNFSITDLTAAISTDGGVTWTTQSMLSANPVQNTATPVSLIFSNVTVGVTNLTNCKIKFTFNGDYYYAMIDDVSISVANPYDLTIEMPNATGNTLAERYQTVMITDNVHVPLQQITAQGLRYGANVKNLGFRNVSSVDNANLEVIIQRNSGGVWTTVHQQSTPIDTIVAGGNGTIVLDSLNTSNWVSVGEHRALYITNLSSVLNGSNDTLVNRFNINDNSYWSKVGLNNNIPASTRSIFPGGTSFNRYEFGSVFSTVAGGIRIDSIDYNYFVLGSYVGSGTQVVKAYVYEWNDGANGGTADNIVDSDRTSGELVLVGEGTDSLSALAAISSGAFNSTIFINDTSTSPQALFLKPNAHYLVTIALEADGSPFTATNSIWLAASESENYSLNLGYPTGVYTSFTHLFLEDGNGNTSGNFIGFAANIVPSFGVHISDPCSTFSATTIVDSIAGFGLANGGVSASASGGAMPYSYVWSNGDTTNSINSLSVGNYSVTVTDAAGCTTSSSVFLIQGTPDLVINEIMYNPVESGTDSTEYIEIYNNEASAVNLEGYYFSQGINFTFPNISVNAGEYLVVSVDSIAVQNRYGVASLEWTSGGLSNSGEDIILKDSLNRTVDSVDYDDNSPWPTGLPDPDGNGPSIELLGFNLDNSIATNWSVSAQMIMGQMINGNQVYGTPGAVNNPMMPLSASINNSNNVSCNGLQDGNITVTPNGGFIPFSYAWSNGDTTANATGLAAGVYTVTVTDNAGNTVTLSDTITEPTAIIVSTSSSDESCSPGNDGTAIVNVTGGTTPYTYLWDAATGGQTTATATGLAAGSYSVTLTDANSCTLTDILTVNSSPIATVSLTSTDVTCNGGSDGSISATATSGSSPYTYLWSNAATTASISGLNVGSYSVTVTDANGCSTTSSAIITEPFPMVLTLTSVDVSCNGATDGSAALNVTGGTAPYTFLWSNNQNGISLANLAAGTYRVTVTDANACTAIDSVSINSSTTILTSVSRAGFTLTADQTGTSYQWLDCNNNNSPIAGETMQNYTATGNGSYAVEITLNGCVDTSACIMILNVGIGEQATEKSLINIYPNPNKGMFTIEVDQIQSNNTPVMIYDLSGSLVKEFTLTQVQQTVDVSGLANGVYFVRWKQQTTKMIINQ